MNKQLEKDFHSEVEMNLSTNGTIKKFSNSRILKKKILFA